MRSIQVQQRVKVITCIVVSQEVMPKSHLFLVFCNRASSFGSGWLPDDNHEIIVSHSFLNVLSIC